MMLTVRAITGVCIAIIILAGLSAHSYGLEIQKMGHFGWGPVESVEVHGNILFVGSGTTLWVYDVSDPYNPEKLSELDLKWYIYGMYYTNGKLYVANEKRLAIVDVSDPLNPVLVGSCYRNPSHGYYSNLYEARDVEVKGNYAFVAAGMYGLQVVDVSDERNPREVGWLNVRSSKLDVLGSYVYIAEGYSRHLWIVDVSEPADPKLVGNFSLPDRSIPGRVFDVRVKDNVAYITEYAYGVWAIDVSDPAKPKALSNVVGDYYLSYECDGIDIKGDYAYVSVWYKGLVVYNISDPHNIKLERILPSYPIVGYTYEVVVEGNLAFVAGHYKGVGIFDISDPKNGEIISYIKTVGRAWPVVLIDDYLYYGSDNGINVLDVSNPSNPKLIYYEENGGRTGGMMLYDESRELLFTGSSWGGLKIYDVTDPAHPELLKRIFEKGYADPLGIVGNYLITNNKVYDVSDPSNPVEIAQMPSLGRVCKASMYGNYLVVGVVNGGYKIVDLTDIHNPEIVSTVLAGKHGFTSQPVFSGHYMFVRIDSTLYVVDLSDIRNPQVIYESRDNLVAFSNLKLYGHYLFACTREPSLKIYDISNVASPVVIGEYPLYGLGSSVEVADGRMYVSEDYWGVEILSHDLESDENIQIFGVTASANESSAVIEWTTNIPSDSTVKYGVSSQNYSFEVHDPLKVVHHTITLTNLTPGTEYYFVVESSSGDSVAVSEEHTFVTAEMVSIDFAPPVTRYVISPTSNNGWFNTTVTVTFYRYDSSGVAYTNYSTTSENGPWITVSGSEPFEVEISKEGTTKLWFFSVDSLGNKEETKMLVVNIDKEPPQITMPSQIVLYQNETESVDITIADANPCNYTVYLNTTVIKNGQCNSTVELEVDTSSQGVWLYKVVARDVAGNIGSATMLVKVIGNSPPIANFTYAVNNRTVSLDARSSYDDGTIVEYKWEFGDGTEGSGATVTHTYDSIGKYTVTLTVCDDGGKCSSTSKTVTVFGKLDNAARMLVGFIVNNSTTFNY